MLHPDYKQGDGELLWNIYYGDFADDDRFDWFRKEQLWDIEVVRPVLEMDEKYARFQLAHQVMNAPSQKSHSHYGWVLLIGAALVIMAAAALWYRQKGVEFKVFNPVESESLLAARKEHYVF